tara:strand:+ start:179 stop:622 length:444 start_codon:yes stop_codon:yes gene_type:complete
MDRKKIFFLMKSIGLIALLIGVFALPNIEDKFSSWIIERRNRKTSEDGLQILIDEYGLTLQDPIEDFNQCSFHYSFYESLVDIGHIDVNLKEKDIFMVNCIPLIGEVLDKCEWDEDSEITFVHLDRKYNLPNNSCRSEVLDPLLIEN